MILEFHTQLDCNLEVRGEKRYFQTGKDYLLPPPNLLKELLNDVLQHKAKGTQWEGIGCEKE